MRVGFQFFYDGLLVFGAPGIGEFSSQIFRVCRCFPASFVHRQVISDLCQIFQCFPSAYLVRFCGLDQFLARLGSGAAPLVRRFSALVLVRVLRFLAPGPVGSARTVVRRFFGRDGVRGS